MPQALLVLTLNCGQMKTLPVFTYIYQTYFKRLAERRNKSTTYLVTYDKQVRIKKLLCKKLKKKVKTIMHAKNYAKKLKNYYANNEKSGKKFG